MSEIRVLISPAPSTLQRTISPPVFCACALPTHDQQHNTPPAPHASSLNVRACILCLCVAEARPLIQDALPRHIHPSTLNSAALIFAGALPTHNRQHNYRIPLNVTARILRLSVANARRTTQLPQPSNSAIPPNNIARKLPPAYLTPHPTSRGLSARGGLISHPPSLPSSRLSSAAPSNRHQAHYLHLNQAVDCSTSTSNRAEKNGQHPPLISICSARLVIFPCLSSLDHKWTGDLWTNSVLESPIGIGTASVRIFWHRCRIDCFLHSSRDSVVSCNGTTGAQ